MLKNYRKFADYFEGIVDDVEVQVVVEDIAKLDADSSLFGRAVSSRFANSIGYTAEAKEV